MYQDIEYNGIRSSSIGVFVRERPSIPAARIRREEIVIPGRDGALYRTDGNYEPTEIPVQMNYICAVTQWEAKWRKIQRWLSATNGLLRFSDDDGFFFKISHVELEEVERPSARVGIFEAVFVTRDGLHYLNSGLREYTPEEIGWNQYEESKPVYRISGEGLCTLIVNGKEMKANVGQNLTIDTERMISYRQDGALQNTAVSGKYADLHLKRGQNEIQISPGFDLRITPNWRCR